MTRMTMRRLALAGFLAATMASTASAAALEELRATLQTLRAAGPLTARLTMETSGQFQDQGEERTRAGSASVVAEDRGPGKAIALVYEDRVLTEAARQPAGRRDARGPIDALRGLDAFEALGLMRPADEWLTDLEGARLIAERAETRAGASVRALDLALKAPRGMDQEKGLKVERTATVWIADSGHPVGARVKTHTEFKRFIFKVTFDVTETTDYGLVAGRLLARRQDSQNRWKAWIVAEGSNSSVTTVEPLE
ncbi:MAG TPA: hypothetical protein VIA29_07835 [Thermoanaerobaculia bacterium]